jgi:hypothetical protein
MAVIIDGGGQPVNITVAASGVVVCPVASILTGGGGGGSGVTDHGALTGLADDDHTQYHTDARGDARYSQLGHNHDHGNLTGLADDDHPQYLNNTRGDIRYALINHGHAASAVSVNASGFNGNLSTSDTNVQAALQKLDDLTVSVSGNLTGIDSISTPDWIQFDTAPGGADATARLRWNSTDGSLNLGMESGTAAATVTLGQQSFQKVTNNSGSTVGVAKAVYLLGSSGNRVSVGLARANAESTSSKTFGLTLESITNNQEGYVITEGLLENVNTAALTEGALVWLSAATAGELTSTRPSAPDHGVLIGLCVRSQSVNGSIFVKIANGIELDELHDVSITTTPTDGHVLTYETSTSLWKPKAPTGVPTSRTISTSTGLTGGGDLSANRTLAVSFGTTSSTVMAGNSATSDIDTFSNANYTSVATRQVIIQGDTTLTAPRTVTLPYAGDLDPGSRVVVNAGPGCTSTNYVQISARPSEFINTTLSSLQITTAFASRVLYTDGVGWWTDPVTMTRGVGGQGAGSTVTEPTTATSLLTSVVTVPPCIAGDVLLINAGVNFTQSASSKTYTFALKLGATTMLSVQPTVSLSATARVLNLQAAIRVLTTTSQAGAMSVVFNTNTSAATAIPYAATGTATENLATSQSLDLLVTTSAAGATQTLSLGSFSVVKVVA